MPLERCGECHIDYPPELLSDFVSNTGRLRACGICALALTNRIHGLQLKQFHGDQAESLRLDAVAWRHTHKVIA